MACKTAGHFFINKSESCCILNLNQGRRKSVNNINVMYWLRDVVACIGPLVGIGGAIFLFIRKKTLPAVLALVGFLLLAVEPLMDIILWRIVAQAATSPNWESMSTAYACLSGIAMFLGTVAIALAFFLGFREPKLPPPPPVDEAGLPPLP
jgi:hypothetical protein